MRYKIHASKMKVPVDKSTPTYLVDVARHLPIFDKVEIGFSYQGLINSYVNEYVEIPLFLTELRLFLEDVSEQKSTRWFLGHAPFAYGRIVSGDLLISSRGGDQFSGNVYDLTQASGLRRLHEQLKKDISRYGALDLKG